MPDLAIAIVTMRFDAADAGHWVQQEAPNAFNDALLGFLATLSAG